MSPLRVPPVYGDFRPHDGMRALSRYGLKSKYDITDPLTRNELSDLGAVPGMVGLAAQR